MTPAKKQLPEKKDIGLLIGAGLLFAGIVALVIKAVSFDTKLFERTDGKKPRW